jgi:hypothetical protein
MTDYARVYPSSGGGFEVRTSPLRILGMHKTRQKAEAQAYAINRRRSEFDYRTDARRSRRDAA